MTLLPEVLLSNYERQQRCVVEGSIHHFRRVLSDLLCLDPSHHLAVPFVHGDDFLDGFAGSRFVANRATEFSVEDCRQVILGPPVQFNSVASVIHGNSPLQRVAARSHKDVRNVICLGVLG